MKQLSVLFDATIIARGKMDSSVRNGIYFVALNLLRQFRADKRLQLTLYCAPEYFSAMNEEKNVITDSRFCGIISRLDKKERQKRKDHKCFQRGVLRLTKKLFLAANKLMLRKTPIFDVAFSPMYAFSKGVRAKRKFTVLHDAIPFILPENRRDLRKGWYKELCASLNGKDAYFAISQSAKNDFLRYCPKLNAAQITVVPNAAAENFHQETDADKIRCIREKYGIPADKKYIFSLCTLTKRKNLMRAVKTFIDFVQKNKIDDLVYVLGGGQVKDFMKELCAQVTKADALNDKIIRAGYIKDEDLAALYSGAQWFVFTSQYEGFGLPPLEAMQCGCPVIVSKSSSLPEVVGNAGVLIDWDSDEQHVEAYENYYFNEDLRRVNALKGLERAKQFSWQKTASLMIGEMFK